MGIKEYTLFLSKRIKSIHRFFVMDKCSVFISWGSSEFSNFGSNFIFVLRKSLNKYKV